MLGLRARRSSVWRAGSASGDVLLLTRWAGEHAQAHLADYAAIFQADAGACPRAGLRPDPWGGYNKLYEADRKPGPIVEAACWVHAGDPSSRWPISPPPPAAGRKAVDSGGSRPRIRDNVAHHSDLISLGVPR